MIQVAFADGSFIFLGIMVLGLLGVIYGFYTKGGSGIAQHPHDGSDGAPGAAGRGEASGRDEGEGTPLDDQGTR